MSAPRDKKCAILISSCDAYRDAWGPFFELFFRYWPDCPFPVFLISTGKIFPDARVTTIPISPDRGWASNMLTALSKYPHPFLLYMQEDYFLKRPVSSLRVQALIDVMQKERAACLMLYPAPGPNSRYKNYRDIGAIRPGTPYRVSLQAGIWNTEVFTRLLKKGERGAEMEHDGSARSYDFSEPFLSVSRGVFFPYDKSAVVDYFSTGITKGRWHGGVRRFFAAQGVSADLSHRPVESSAAARRHFLKSLPFLSPLVRFAFRIEYKLKTLFE